jgi:hypothetical protein
VGGEEVAEFQDLILTQAQQTQDNLVVVVVVGLEPQTMNPVEDQVIKDMVVVLLFISLQVQVEEWVKQVKLMVGVYQQREVMDQML